MKAGSRSGDASWAKGHTILVWGPRGPAGVQASRAILRPCQDAHQSWATVPLHSFPSPCSDLLSLRNESTGWGSIWHLEGLPEDLQGGGGVKDGKRNGMGLTSRKPGWGPGQPSQAGGEGLPALSWGTCFHQGTGLSQERWRCVWRSLSPNLSGTRPLRGFEGHWGLWVRHREQAQRSPETHGLVRSPSPFPIRLC